MKLLRTFSDEIQAEMARMQLRSQEINAVLSKDDCGGMTPVLQLTGGIKLLVPEEDFARSEEALLEMDSEDLSDLLPPEG